MSTREAYSGCPRSVTSGVVLIEQTVEMANPGSLCVTADTMSYGIEDRSVRLWIDGVATDISHVSTGPDMEWAEHTAVQRRRWAPVLTPCS